MCDSDHPIIN